jgi:hypothetical protein
MKHSLISLSLLSVLSMSLPCFGMEHENGVQKALPKAYFEACAPEYFEFLRRNDPPLCEPEDLNYIVEFEAAIKKMMQTRLANAEKALAGNEEILNRENEFLTDVEPGEASYANVVEKTYSTGLMYIKLGCYPENENSFDFENECGLQKISSEGYERRKYHKFKGTYPKTLRIEASRDLAKVLMAEFPDTRIEIIRQRWNEPQINIMERFLQSAQKTEADPRRVEIKGEEILTKEFLETSFSVYRSVVEKLKATDSQYKKEFKRFLQERKSHADAILKGYDPLKGEENDGLRTSYYSTSEWHQRTGLFIGTDSESAHNARSREILLCYAFTIRGYASGVLQCMTLGYYPNNERSVWVLKKYGLQEVPWEVYKQNGDLIADECNIVASKCVSQILLQELGSENK